MWGPTFRAPGPSLSAKGPPMGDGSHGPRSSVGVSALAINSKWKPTKQPWGPAAQFNNRSAGNLCGRDMSPICSDASDTEQIDRNPWTFPHGCLAVPPPPPPPPPDNQSSSMPSAPSSSSALPSTGVYYSPLQSRITIPLPPPSPPCLAGGTTAMETTSEDSGRPPTPPWRKNTMQKSYSADMWQGVLPSKHGIPVGEQQQQSGTEPVGIALGGGPALIDPYALSDPTDPYAVTSSCSGSSTCTASSLSNPKSMNSGSSLVPTPPITASAESSLAVCNSLPLLLPPPIPNKATSNAEAPAQRPSSSTYMYPPTAPPAAAREGELWLPMEAHRARQRLRGRHRREAGPSLGVLGGAPAFPFSPQCYYPPQQHPQQADRASLALRRTCYRCRRRGHEASECPTGQGPRQMRSEG